MTSVRIDCWCCTESAGNVRVVMRSGAWDVVRIIGRRRVLEDPGHRLGRLVVTMRQWGFELGPGHVC